MTAILVRAALVLALSVCCLFVEADGQTADTPTPAPAPQSAAGSARTAAEKILGEGDRLLAQAGATAAREAIEKFKSALDLFREAEHRPGEALALFRIGQGYVRLDSEMRSARDYLSQALALAPTIGDRSLEAAVLLSLGQSYPAAAERERVLGYFDRALKLYQGLNDLRGQAVALTNLGTAITDLGEYRKALEHLDQALTRAEAVNDRLQVGRIHLNGGLAHQYLGDSSTALEKYGQALALANATGNLELALRVTNNTGIVYKELGDYRRALDHYHPSLELVRKLGYPFREAQVLNNIGNVYKAEAETQKSLDYYDQALAISRRLQNPVLVSTVLNNIGSAYAQIGEHQKALDHHLQSREIRSTIGDRRGESSSLNQAGVARHKLGAMEEAIDYLRRSLEIRQHINDRIGEAETLLNLAAVERDRGDPEASRATIEAALTITESLRSKISDAGLRASYIARVQATYETYVDLLMRLHARSPSAGFDAAALQAAERTRARVLLESLVEARAGIREGVDAVLLEREGSLQRKLDAASERVSRSLSSKSSQSEIATARKDLEALTLEYQQLQNQIRASSPRYAALTQPEPLTAAQIQQDVLDNDTVLLEFALGEERSWLWAVTPLTVASIELAPRRDIEAAARSLYAELTARQPREGEAAAAYANRVAAADRRLRDRAAVVSRMLLGGVADQLNGPWRGKRLAIVASGALEYLPFASLPLPTADDRSAAGQVVVVPLIARHEIVEAPSASVLATLRREAAGRQAPQRAVAVLADPVFDRTDPRVTRSGRQAPTGVVASRSVPPPNTTLGPWHLTRAVQRIDEVRGTGGLARLPFSRDEAAAIVSLAGRGETLSATDFQASRATALGRALENYRIVHFATHGLIDSERPDLSGLILSLVDDRGAPQDGFLRVHDIYNMRLSADLVVLSACQTALGREIKGEGLVGLTRGFMYAGAPRVVASLWQVSDLATAELMKRFYAGMLQRRLPAAAALRTAQLEMAKDPRWASPYFWAGFVLQGDWK